MGLQFVYGILRNGMRMYYERNNKYYKADRTLGPICVQLSAEGIH
jgi:hypothetical protein